MTRLFPEVCLYFLSFYSFIGFSRSEFSYKYNPPSLNILKPGENQYIQLSIEGITEDVLIEVSSSNEASVRVLGTNRFNVKRTENFCQDQDQISPDPRNVSITVNVEGVYVGISELQFEFKARDVFKDSPYQVESYPVIAGISTSTLKVISTYIIMVWLILSYITMGTKITWKAIKPKIIRPQGILIGIACQFILMPGLSFLLAKMTSLEPTGAVGLIIDGSCPGGWLSNIFTALLDCDLVLSLTMTFCSTVLAIAFMPLNMFLYATPFTKNDESLRTPFKDIFIQLITLVIPVFIGIFISYKFPKAGKKLSKFIKPVSVIVIIISLSTGVYANLYAYSSPFSLWFASGLLPLIGGLLGLIIAKVTCLANRSAITVGLETGAQNSFLALSMATLSYPQPASALISRPPLLVATLTIIEGIIAVVIYLLMTKFPGRPEGGHEDQEESFFPDIDVKLRRSPKKSAKSTGINVGIQADFQDIIQSWSHGGNKDAQNGSVRSLSGKVNLGFDASSLIDMINPDAKKYYI
ncbi:Solute carrier family 10 member 6 [Holothuria leucospilota]|uniref:Solute carrier family 10 member 6 n=1 Tax=Holothuria leucospilota TaxID=206669 RepID=A0A9Q1CBI4_HOLLE|nr:Solute carrier family 10 member 6 [Holothuria leucospilota]